VSGDQEPGDGAPADGELQKVACYEKSSANPLKTLSEIRVFSAVCVHQANGRIFRNIRPSDAPEEAAA
jgi:hypothetical protein